MQNKTNKMKILIPGPVYLTDEIKFAQAKDMISHRGEEYRELHNYVIKKLCELFNSDTAFLVTASGTGGVEAAVASSLSKKDKVICLINGVFGKRMADATKIYAGEIIEHKIENGKGFSLERVKKIIDDSNADAITMVYNETSTGVLNRAEEICRYAKSRGMFVIVDGISAIGGHTFDMKSWGIDVCILGNQKCLGAPPGLVLLGATNSAVDRIEKNETKSYYFDLKRYKKSQEKGQTPFTPAVSLVYALKEALDTMFEEGVDNRIKRHVKAAAYVRDELKKMGFDIFAESGFESNTITAFVSNQSEEIKSQLKSKYNIVISGGQDDLKGKILRIGHLGNFKFEDLEECMDALREIKRRLE